MAAYYQFSHSSFVIRYCSARATILRFVMKSCSYKSKKYIFLSNASSLPCPLKEQ
jgi:hypothetical protein